jgi:hypothetical protein
MASGLGRWKAFRPMIEPKPPPACLDGLDFTQQPLICLEHAAGEDHDPPAVEGGLDDAAHPPRRAIYRPAAVRTGSSASPSRSE